MNRECVKCHMVKPLAKFSKHPRGNLGHLRTCTSCKSKARWKKIKATTTREERHQKRLAYLATPNGNTAVKKGQKKWRDGPKGKAYNQRPDVRDYRNAKSRKYRKRNPAKTAAREAVKCAWRRGAIPRAKELSCRFCGKQAHSYHHIFGYAPENHFDIVPLCRPCHFKADRK